MKTHKLFSIDQEDAIQLELLARQLKISQSMIMNAILKKELVANSNLINEKFREIQKVIQEKQKKILEK